MEHIDSKAEQSIRDLAIKVGIDPERSKYVYPDQVPEFFTILQQLTKDGKGCRGGKIICYCDDYREALTTILNLPFKNGELYILINNCTNEEVKLFREEE